MSALWIGISILSINIGVVGGLARWNVRLDIIAMITIVMSIGFSVDYATHITFHYLLSRDDHRLHSAFRIVAIPIVQSALSTAIGVLTLAPVAAYMVRTFVKTVLLVVGIGLVHAMVFLPVFLTLCVTSDEYLHSVNNHRDTVRNYLTLIPQYIGRRIITNKRMRCYIDQQKETPTVEYANADVLTTPVPDPPITVPIRINASVPLQSPTTVDDDGFMVIGRHSTELTTFK
jgi:hypothetical protein